MKYRTIFECFVLLLCVAFIISLEQVDYPSWARKIFYIIMLIAFIAKSVFRFKKSDKIGNEDNQGKCTGDGSECSSNDE